MQSAADRNGTSASGAVPPPSVRPPPTRPRMMRLELRVSERFEEVAATAAAWLQQVGADADPVDVQRVQPARAVADTRSGRIEDGAAQMRVIREWALERGERYLQARAERQLGVLLRRAGEGSASLEHAVTSVNLLGADAPVAVRADHQIGLADALCVSGSSVEAPAADRTARKPAWRAATSTCTCWR